MNRTFGPMTEGSVRGSIITLAASACGSGVMVFPSFCVVNGLFLMLLAIVIAALGCYWGHYMLT